jgi:hypothetical protein
MVDWKANVARVRSPEARLTVSAISAIASYGVVGAMKIEVTEVTNVSADESGQGRGFVS